MRRRLSKRENKLVAFSHGGQSVLYLECPPAIDQTLFGKSEASIVTGCNLREHSAGREARVVNRSRRGFFWIELWFRGVAIFVFNLTTNLLPPAAPLRVTSQRTMIVDTPCQDLVFVSKSNTMHATCCDLDNSDGGSGEIGIETRAKNVVGGALGPEAKYARIAGAEDIDVQNISRAIVEDDFGFRASSWTSAVRSCCFADFAC